MEWHEPTKVMTPCRCGRTVTITQPAAIDALDALRVKPMCEVCKREVEREFDEKWQPVSVYEW